MGKAKRWYCEYSECRVLLGIEEDGVVRIKRKDMYVEIKSADAITVTCYKCGKRNTITKEAPEARTVTGNMPEGESGYEHTQL